MCDINLPCDSFQQERHKSRTYIQVLDQHQEQPQYPSTKASGKVSLSLEEAPVTIQKHKTSGICTRIHTRTKHNIVKEKDRKVNTQRLLAMTVCFTASTNSWVEGEGMHILSAPIFIRRAFSSGRKSTIRPSSLLYALRPSKSPWRQHKLAWLTIA